MKKINFRALANRGAMGLRIHSPEILVGSGVVGVVVGTVMACRATYKGLSEIVVTHRKEAELVHENSTDDPTKRKELTKVYLNTGVQFAKLYGPSATVGALSVAGILAGNNILRKRNVALAAAYAAVDAGFKQYRGRVVERFGEDVDRQLRANLRREKIERTVTDENGREKKVKETVDVVGDGTLSGYARYFARGDARAAETNEDYNRFFLQSRQELANHMLRANGFLFLNDVYDMLGIDRSIAGQIVGWVYDKSGEHGDNYVDFGIQEVYRENRDRPGEYEKVFLLDFNVDGSILDHSFEKGLITQ